MANLNVSETKKAIRELGLKKGAGRGIYVYAMGAMIPALMAEFIVRAMAGRLDEDDDDEYLDDVMDMFFFSQARNTIAMIPGGNVLNPTISKVKSAMSDGSNTRWMNDNINVSPIFTVLEASLNAPWSVAKWFSDDGPAKPAIKDTLMLISFLTGIPFTALSKPLGYAASVAEGDTEPENAVDYARGLVAGR